MTEEERVQFADQDKTEGLQRRDFLKMLGASFAALASGCDLRPPTDKILPYSEQPEGTVPGLSRWYASTCGGCSAACGTLVKSRDGRPIKMEGNPDHPLSRGGLCARGLEAIMRQDGAAVREAMGFDDRRRGGRIVDDALGAVPRAELGGGRV